MPPMGTRRAATSGFLAEKRPCVPSLKRPHDMRGLQKVHGKFQFSAARAGAVLHQVKRLAAWSHQNAGLVLTALLLIQLPVDA